MILLPFGRGLFVDGLGENYVASELLDEATAIDEWYANHPEKIHPGFLAGARQALKNGIDRDTILVVYGERITVEAERQLKEEQDRKS